MQLFTKSSRKEKDLVGSVETKEFDMESLKTPHMDGIQLILKKILLIQ